MAAQQRPLGNSPSKNRIRRHSSRRVDDQVRKFLQETPSTVEFASHPRLPRPPSASPVRPPGTPFRVSRGHDITTWFLNLWTPEPCLLKSRGRMPSPSRPDVAREQSTGDSTGEIALPHRIMPEELILRTAAGFRTPNASEIAVFHGLGELPEPKLTHRFH